jgi:hypothetical protein
MHGKGIRREEEDEENEAIAMLTEREFCVQWRKLFAGSTIDEAAYALADGLIEELPQTSPLRLRYGKELSDLQQLRAAAGKPAAKPSKRRARG